MQSGTAMHGQAASALSEVRSRYILDPISIRANHPFFWVGANFPGLGRGMRGPKQALDWLRAVCADPNRHSIGFAQCARPKTGTRLASRSVRGSKQALDWLRAVCADPNRHSIGFAQCARTQTGTRLGRQGRLPGLPGTKQIPPHSCTRQTSPASAEACAKPNRGLFCFSRCARPQTEVCLLQPMCASQTEVCLASIPTDSDGSNALHGVKPPSSTRHSFLLDNNTSHGRTPSPSLLHNTPSYE